MRNSGSVSLRRKVGGVIRAIASAPLTVIPNRTYKVRLESIGTRHRVYVDGVPLLDADDDSLASGRAALLTNHTAADFDNVIVSPTPTVTMYAFDLERPFEFPNPGYFTESGPGLWLKPNDTGRSYMTQASVAGDARIVTGVPTDDQSIDVRARATTFAGTGSGDRWFGIMARHRRRVELLLPLGPQRQHRVAAQDSATARSRFSAPLPIAGHRGPVVPPQAGGRRHPRARLRQWPTACSRPPTPPCRAVSPAS